jgi:tRNA threonylcarbamoyladenosine biosynthesis protein TsaE
MMAQISIKSIQELESVANKFLKDFPDPQVILFQGDMGVGKTTFIKTLSKLLGVQEEVTSPTYSLINEYRNDLGQSIYHMDCYRLEKEEEALDFGIEEYFNSEDWCLVEWPEKIKSLIPPEAAWIRITADGVNRSFSW